MRVLLTGASSFTGLWFAEALAAAGHDVVAAARSAAYDDPLRAARWARVARVAEMVPSAPFGSDAFLHLLRARRFDALCLHGAEVGDYKSPAYDIASAVEANTVRLAEAFALAEGARVIATGTVFEPGEGIGEEPLVAFSPYAEAKALTGRRQRQAAEAAGLAFVKFVIPNPFGPWEDRRFQRHVMTRWSRGEPVHVDLPLYVRDNIPSDLLALAYVRAVEGGFCDYCAPSGYAGPVGGFFRLMASEVSARTGWACELTLADDQAFTEPRVRTNRTHLDHATLRWSEAAFWDAYADHYLRPPVAL